jgi:PAS domain-containing protein
MADDYNNTDLTWTAQPEVRSAFFDTVVENFPGVLVIMGPPPDLRIVAANRRFIQLLPEPFRSAQTIVGLTTREVSREPTPQSESALQLINRVYETGEAVSFEQYEAGGPDRDKRYWNWSVVPMEGPGGADNSSQRLICS